MGMTDAQEGKSLYQRLKCYIKPVLLGAFAGAVAAGLLLCAAALLYGTFHAGGETIPAAAVCIAVLSGLAAGFAGARLRKKRGLLTGGCSAMLLAGILLLIGWFLSGVPEAAALTRAAVITAAGMLGGVLAVNGKGCKAR